MDRRLGVLAFGDSITNGGGELQWGVALHSWALWTARGLGMPYTGCARDGATAHDVAARQIPVFVDTAVDPEGRYDVGLLYIGVNDVRTPGWDAEAYERDLGAAVRFLRQRCTRVLVCTLPLDLGRPRASGERIAAANAAIGRLEGVLVCDLSDFGARNRVMVDAVHPTAFGQVAIAERALDLLAEHGLEPHTRPSSLISYETTRRGRLRGDLTYVYRHAKISARAAALSASASARRRRRRAV
jgi:lysophospholipase L1-like esterase